MKKKMNILALTDGLAKENPQVEYVIVEKITRFQPFKHMQVIRKPGEETMSEPGKIARFFGQKPKKIYGETEVTEYEVSGSLIQMDNGEYTYVRETPEQIRTLLAKGKFTKVKGA